MLDRNLCKQYADGLTKLVARLRADLKAPELKWYIAEDEAMRRNTVATARLIRNRSPLPKPRPIRADGQEQL